MGNALQDQGKLEEAIEAYNKSIAIKPDNAEAYYSMGNTLRQQGKLEEAIEAYNKALAIKPDYVEAHNNMGATLKDQGKLEEAIEAYNKALAIKSDYAEVYYNMGLALQEQGKLEEAIEAYNKAVAIKLDYAEAYNNMGNALTGQGHQEKAIEAYNKALAIKPDYAEAYNNMGNALTDQSKLEEAIHAYNKALAIKPDFVEAYSNTGIALKDQGKLDEAIEAYNNALAIEPEYAEAHNNMSLSLLALKDFNRGFKQSEWRWRVKKLTNQYLKSAKPVWNGEENQRVFVWAEQGIGDEVMFASIIPELHAVSLQVIVRCDERLIPLFQRSFPAGVIYFSKAQEVPIDEYDFHIPLGSLPLTFRKSLDSFKNSASGFLKHDKEKTQRLRSGILGGLSKKVIGISWKTESTLRQSEKRNIKLSELIKVLCPEKNHIVSLQYGDVSDEIKVTESELGIRILQEESIDNQNDIDGLASLMAACNLVVTIDNFTTHLSGGLGLPTKLMLPYASHSNWSLTDDESYWYSNVQLYRQSKVNNWHSVLSQIQAFEAEGHGV
tara:strand:+ start:1 stop:1656 length:1656 start_codon:yes stop_codon:yes gene_type:complete